jgi:hypothetical protein
MPTFTANSSNRRRNRFQRILTEEYERALKGGDPDMSDRFESARDVRPETLHRVDPEARRQKAAAPVLAVLSGMAVGLLIGRRR